MVMTPELADRVETFMGFRPVPGTLNVRLEGPLSTELPFRIGAEELGLDPAETGQSGYRWAPCRVQGRVPAVVVRPEEPGYPSDLVEVVAPVHLRTTLGLEDGAPVTLQVQVCHR